MLLAVVERLVDDEHTPATLRALGPAAAVLDMADGSVVAIFTPAFGPADAIGQRIRQFIEQAPSTHFKFAIIGGPAELSAQLPSGAGMFSRRALQTYRLELEEDSDRDAVNLGGGARRDSLLARALQAGADKALTIPTREQVEARLQPVEVSPQQLERAREHNRFVQGLQGPRTMTWILLGLFVAVFALEELWGGSTTISTLVRMGGNTQDSLQEPWRWLSSAVLHAGFVHLGVNGFVLVVLGGFMERLLGMGRYALLLLVAAIGGSVASSLLSEAAVAVGASGAIWGVLGAAAAIAWRPGSLVPPTVVPALRRNAIINLVINFSVSFLPGIDLWAHLGGGIAGAVLVLAGGLMRDAESSESSEAADSAGRGRTGLRFVPAACAALVLASVATAWIRQEPWMLTSRAPAVTQTLGDRLVLDVPPALTSPRAVEDEPPLQTWELGDPWRDPLWLSVTVQPHPYDEASRAEWARTVGMDGPQMPAEVTVTHRWAAVADAEHPTFETRYRYANGVHSGLWVQLRPSQIVRIEHARGPEVDEWWGAALRHILESVREP